jgi:carbamoyl-phosphate synthase large subunit
VTKKIGSGMKSVGEVMAIGRTFEEALQKGLRMLDISVDGLQETEDLDAAALDEELRSPTDERVFAVYTALSRGMSIERIYELSHVDPWFLAKLKNIVDISVDLKKCEGTAILKETFKNAKRLGFADRQIATLSSRSEKDVRRERSSLGVRPAIKQIDTLAAEYPAKTNYLYCTYSGEEDDVDIGSGSTVMVLGSGAYRIGSSVEFDWCCVNTVQALRRLGFKTIMVNCNPETVSTDFDECDRLYFEELTFETVMNIYEKEKPLGIILGVGGQVANTLAIRLAGAGVNILGTQATSIDRAEDRHKFSSLLDELLIAQPEWQELSNMSDALTFAERVGYPVLVRPSYVLSGAAMAVALDDEQLTRFLGKAADVSQDHPVVISKFILGAKEIELDGVAEKGNLIAYVISEHVENAGVHSGDATMVVPPQRTYLETIRKVKQIASRVAAALEINGPFNIQFLAKDNEVSVIECNLRASRSFPFVSKVCGTNLIDIATKVMIDWPVPEINLKPFNMEYVGVKAPQFSFTRLKGADPTLSVEMSSTGEVGCLGDDFEEAFLKAMLSVGLKLPIKKVLLSTGPTESKVDFLPAAKALKAMDIKIVATEGTAKFLAKHGIESEAVSWPVEGGSKAADARIRAGDVDLVVNIPKNYQHEELTNGYLIRRAAADFGVPLVTNIQLARRIVESISKKSMDDLSCKHWMEYGFL